MEVSPFLCDEADAGTGGGPVVDAAKDEFHFPSSASKDEFHFPSSAGKAIYVQKGDRLRMIRHWR